jgi:glycosyltransferase involved in cell wall biosynthesis
MRVLWFTNSNVNYHSGSFGYNGGGWISALQKELVKSANVELAISFFFQDEPFKVQKKNVMYYPISINRSILNRFKRLISRRIQEQSHIAEFKKVISDFKPDIIHVFGSEKTFGLVVQLGIPTVIHIQGVLISYYNALLPPSYSKLDFICSRGFNLIRLIFKYRELRYWKYAVEREKRILEGCKYFMGRTEWDKRIIKIHSPASTYFYCNEMLREEFFVNFPWEAKLQRNKKVIVTIISDPIYKGADLLLKTAKILKKDKNLNFEWFVFGISDLSFASRKTGIKADEVSVFLKGVATTIQLVAELKNCDVYVHPSYIENSPNSVCEAQLLGVPVIACNVGGINSLIDHMVSGILVPSNDPYVCSSYIQEIFSDYKLANNLGNNAREIALKRHDKGVILNDLMEIYRKIIKSPLLLH